jgi:Holliday junction resolvase
MSGKRKGVKFERELIHRLWEYGYAAMRSPGSGATSYPMPDIVAGNGERFVAIEVKMRAKLPVYLSEQEVKELVMFANLFGCKPFIAVKISRSDWKFFQIAQLKETKKGYKIDKETFMLGIDLEEMLGKSVQEKFV